MKTTKRTERGAAAPVVPSVRVYCDGAGARPDGKGSGYAWLQEGSERRAVHREDGLSNNEAEYRALQSALDALPAGAEVEVLMDSFLICSQFAGRFRVFNPRLAALLAAVRGLIERKNLKVKLTWIPRQENLADKLL